MLEVYDDTFIYHSSYNAADLML